MPALLRRILVEGLGWLLVAAGIAALILPGPGLVMLAAGLVLLSQQYEWAARRVDPVKRQALKGAAGSVQTWPRILGTVAGILALFACSALWLRQPDVPGWWPIAHRWWLPGGLATGITLAISALLALGLLVWSYVTFRHDDEAVAEVRRQADQGAPSR